MTYDASMKYRRYTYKLYPVASQIGSLESYADGCRLIWNLGLDQRLNHHRNYQRSTGKNLSYFTQSGELKALRAEFDWIKATPACLQQQTLRSLQKAFELYWRNGFGKPKFKKKTSYISLIFPGQVVDFEITNGRWGRVRLPKIGWVKFRFTRPIKGKICEATVSKTPLGWQISFTCKFDEDVVDNGLTVGVDRGVTVPIMLSDGTSYSLPAEIEKHERAARRAQRVPINKRAYDALVDAKAKANTDYVIEYADRPIISVKKGLQAASRRSGIQCSAHVLRHTAGVWMAEADIPMQKISQYLGHTSTRVTETVYARYSPSFMKDAAEALDW